MGPDARAQCGTPESAEGDAPITPTPTLVGAEDKQDDARDTSTPTVHRTVISLGTDAQPEDSEDDTIKPLPDRLVTELTAHRTLALQDALASNPPVALTALLHTLCLDLLGLCCRLPSGVWWWRLVDRVAQTASSWRRSLTN